MIDMYNVDIICDSIANGVRLTTVSLTYPRFIHSEFLRHRMLSHSVESSRAVPTERLIERVRTQPFVPETFNQRVKGMGVGDPLSEYDSQACEIIWRQTVEDSANCAEGLMAHNVDKSRVNRLLEPFMFVTDLVTGTDWDNFFALRDHPDAQPEFQKIARMMREAFKKSTPIELYEDEWHLPLVRYEDEFLEAKETKAWEGFARVSAGRCARWSYGVDPVAASNEDSEKSYERAGRLEEGFHMSPFEHQAHPYTEEEIDHVKGYEFLIAQDHELSDDIAKAMLNGLWYSGNLKAWHQFRKTFKNEDNFALA